MRKVFYKTKKVFSDFDFAYYITFVENLFRMNTIKHKILLVDDEPDILEFVSYNLKKEGYQMFTANNGKEAMSIAKQEKPDLIILDVMMPNMDGIETCREIRDIHGLQNVLIAFLTARNEDYSQIAGFEVGADDYINKPIKPRVLISRIKALLRRSNIALQEGNPEKEETGNIKIDREKYNVLKNGIEINLPKK